MGKITGKLIKIDDTQTVGSKGFQKREFVIETDDNQYPQKLKISLLGQDYVGLIDSYRLGEKVAVDYTLKGSEWNGKYYVEVSCWKIDAVGKKETGGGANVTGGGAEKKTTSQMVKEEAVDYDDLPF